MHLTFLLGASLAALALAAPTPGYYFNGNAGELGWTVAEVNGARTNSPTQPAQPNNRTPQRQPATQRVKNEPIGSTSVPCWTLCPQQHPENPAEICASKCGCPESVAVRNGQRCPARSSSSRLLQRPRLANSFRQFNDVWT